jgi:hypothetical protein
LGYLIVSLVSASIHVTTIFFSIFVIADRRLSKHISKGWLIFIIAVIFLIGNYYFAAELDSKLERYDYGVSLLTRTLLVVLFIGNLFFIRLVNNQSMPSNLTTAQFQYIDRNVNLVVIANTLLLILLPAAFMNLNALRIFRYLAIVNFVFVTNKFGNSSANIWGHTFVAIMYAMAYAYISYLMHSTSFKIIIDTIFNDNLFF